MTVQYIDPFGPPWRFQWLRMIFAWKGGIFQSFWLEWFIAVVVCVLALTISYVATKDRDVDDWPDTLETLAEVVAFIGRRFQAAIGMMLGFYTSTMYGRWTAVVDKEQEAQRRINDVALRIAWSIKESNDGRKGHKDEEKDEHAVMYDNGQQQSRRIRTKLVRLMNLSHAIVIGQLYEKPDNDFSSLDKLLACGLATKKEYDFLNGQSTDFKFVAPLVWFQDIIRKMVENKTFGFDSGKLGFEFGGLIVDLRGALSDLYTLRNQPVPLIYRQMVNVVIRMYMFMLLLDGIL